MDKSLDIKSCLTKKRELNRRTSLVYTVNRGSTNKLSWQQLDLTKRKKSLYTDNRLNLKICLVQADFQVGDFGKCTWSIGSTLIVV
jgi:hypothetical protein